MQLRDILGDEGPTGRAARRWTRDAIIADAAMIGAGPSPFEALVEEIDGVLDADCERIRRRGRNGTVGLMRFRARELARSEHLTKPFFWGNRAERRAPFNAINVIGGQALVECRQRGTPVSPATRTGDCTGHVG